MAQIAGPHRARLYRRILTFVAGTSLAFYYGIFGGGYDADPRGFAAIVVWAVIAAGLATGIFPRTRLPRGWWIVAALIAALAAWTALSLTWSDSAGKTYVEVTRVIHYGGLVLLAWLALDRHTASAAAAGVFAGAFAITGLALASRLLPDAFPTPDLVELGSTARRLEYPFGYWNALGAWAAMTAAMGVAWAAHARLLPVRIAAAAAIPIAGVVVYLTYSRGSVIGLGVGILIAILASRRRWSAALIAAGGGAGAAVGILAVRDRPEIAEALGSAGAGAVAIAIAGGIAVAGLVVLVVVALRVDRWRVGEELTRSVAAVGVATLVMVAVGAFASGFAGDVWDRVGSDPQAASTSPKADPADANTSERFTGLESSRADIYDAALDAYSTAPLLGIGAGDFEFWWARHPATGQYLKDAHSIYIEALAELGPLGLALVVGVIASLALMAIAARARTQSSRRAGAAAAALGALAVFAVQGGIDWFWEYTAIPAVALGGAAAAASSRAGAQPRPAPEIRIRVALVVGAVALVIALLPPWLAIRSVRASEEAIAAGDAKIAIREAKAAVSAEGWSAQAHVQLARARAAAGELDRAAEALREAIDREPLNWRHRAQLAGLEQARANEAAAESAERQANRLYRLPSPAVEFVKTEMFQLAS